MIVINPELLQREVLFVAATALALGLFMAFGRRGGARTRVGDLARGTARGELHTPLRDMYAYSDDWAGQTQVACPLGFEGPVPQACVVWEITLFGARALEDMQSVSLAGGRYFEIGHDARESARILAPFVRKLVSRFRVDYEHARPVIVVGQTPQGNELDGSEGPSALLGFEPPKHAFPAGAERGAGQSTLTVRGSQ